MIIKLSLYYVSHKVTKATDFRVVWELVSHDASVLEFSQCIAVTRCVVVG